MAHQHDVLSTVLATQQPSLGLGLVIFVIMPRDFPTTVTVILAGENRPKASLQQPRTELVLEPHQVSDARSSDKPLL